MTYLFIVAIIISLDRWVKYWVTVNIELGSKVGLLPGFISLTHTQNYGAAFGIFQNARWPLVIVSAAAVGIIIYLLAKNKIARRVGRISLACVMGGAVGNLIDRLITGYVVDMFEFDFINFAIFNVADIFLTLGGIVFVVWYIWYETKRSAEEKNSGKLDN